MSAPSRGVMNRLRRVATRSPLSRVLLQPRVRKTLAGILATRFLIAARQTTEPGRFLADELAGRASSARSRAGRRADLRADSRVPRTYTLRSTGRQLPVRLPADLEAFYELFDRAEYAPPEPLETRLTADRVHRILDIGANCGMFAVWATGQWPNATITAFEPDPDSVAALRHTLAVSQAPIEIVAAAAATSPGTLRFTTGWGGGSHTAREGEDGIDVPTVDIFEHLRRADLAKIDIEGHTDSDGDADANLKLSQARARAVADFLTKAGLPNDRISSNGFGPTRPIASNETPEGKAINRRIEFHLK